MLSSRAMKSKADKIEGLLEALHAEFEAIRADVPGWGLDPLGMDRVLSAVAAFEANTAVDMTTWRLTSVSVQTNLAARLRNLRELKEACAEAVAGALRCDWLREWMVEAERDPDMGLSPALPPKEKVWA